MTTQPLPRHSTFDATSDSPLAFDYDHVGLIPRRASTLSHRADARPEVQFGPVHLSVPLLGSPMPDVCGTDMCRALTRQGAMGILHRFQAIGEQVAEFSAAREGLSDPVAIGAAVGVTDDFRERFQALYAAGCRIVCIDTANGAHTQVAHAMDWIKSEAGDIFVVAGNVASGEAFTWLEERGADAIRVGIAGGSVCETRTETAVYVPTPYAVHLAAKVRRRALIIGDSGVRTPADLCKLLALGADLAMVGSALAGTKEAPGRVLMVDGKKFKIMRGAASFSVQQQAGRFDPAYVEGSETLAPYKGKVEDVIERYLAGLRSSMSYMDARDLATYCHNVDFVRLS